MHEVVTLCEDKFLHLVPSAMCLLKSAGKTRPLELEDISRLDESDGGRAGAVRNLLTLFHAGEVGASVTKRETALVELSKRHQPLSEAPREQVRLSSRV